MVMDVSRGSSREGVAPKLTKKGLGFSAKKATLSSAVMTGARLALFRGLLFVPALSLYQLDGDSRVIPCVHLNHVFQETFRSHVNKH